MNIVIWDALLYHESRFYSAHPEMYRAFAGLNRVPELDANIRLIFRMNQFVPEQFWKLEDVENHAQDTALVDVDQIGLDALRRAGFTAKVRFVEPFRVVYLERNR